MPTARFGETEIHYEEHGSGFPILLLASGGMNSRADAWMRAPVNPITLLSSEYRVIAMDQRNAGCSVAPVRATDGWHVYTDDQLALLDYLGVDQVHAVGRCIGGPFIMGLIERAPERVVSAAVFQPIGYHGNRDVFFGLFDKWAEPLRAARPYITTAMVHAFREAMYGGDFLFNPVVTREFVKSLPTPLLVCMGSDIFHPESISREIAGLAPRAELIEDWQSSDQAIARAAAQLTAFIRRHTP